MRYTKSQLKSAMFLFLDNALPQYECELIKKRGSIACPTRCDMCMFLHYIERVKSGEKPKIERGE